MHIRGWAGLLRVTVSADVEEADRAGPVDEVGGGGEAARRPAFNRRSPLARTPTWLKACGKFPRNSPVPGWICSGNNPNGFARPQSVSYSA